MWRKTPPCPGGPKLVKLQSLGKQRPFLVLVNDRPTKVQWRVTTTTTTTTTTATTTSSTTTSSTTTTATTTSSTTTSTTTTTTATTTSSTTTSTTTTTTTTSTSTTSTTTTQLFTKLTGGGCCDPTTFIACDIFGESTGATRFPVAPVELALAKWLSKKMGGRWWWHVEPYAHVKGAKWVVKQKWFWYVVGAFFKIEQRFFLNDQPHVLEGTPYTAA